MIVSTASEGTSLLLIEATVTSLCLGVALCAPSASILQARRILLPFSALARHRAICVLLVGFAAIGLRLAILPWSPVPKPFLLPDFSFLLAADTFALGRLVNPPPPMWTHFESFHITVFPTYMSMYFPAQGLILAAGIKLLGHPWFGVLVSTAFMCAALCWMLQAWLPPRWALLGGLLAVVRLGLFSYWIDTYDGGSVAALGGALVVGALPRIWRHLRTRDFFLLAVGMVVLANSRPYEGLLLSGPSVAILCWKIKERSHPSAQKLLSRCVPGLIILACSALLMAYYNHRVFGNILTPPYKVNREMYATAPHFLSQSLRPEPVYRHEEMREFYSNFERSEYLKAHSIPGFLISLASKAITAQYFFLGVIFLIPAAALPIALKDQRIRVLIILAAVSACGLAIETFMIPHYIAPFTAVLYAVLMQCMRHMQTWSIAGRKIGMVLVPAIPAACIVLCLIRLYAGPLHIALAPAQFASRAWFGSGPHGLERDRILTELWRRPGKQLVLVKYAPGHNVLNDWVSNAPDIDSAKVVWARNMSSSQNIELMRYFSDRTVWIVEPDSTPARVSRLQTGSDPANAAP